MNRKLIPLFFVLLPLITSCNLHASFPNKTAAPGGSTPSTGTAAATVNAPSGSSLYTAVALPKSSAVFPSAPITAIPKSTAQLGGESFDAYQVPGDRLRVLCKQPCPLSERLIDAAYAGYKVTIQLDVRTAGFDVLDKWGAIDIHLSRDNTCQRSEGELGLTVKYRDVDGIGLCLYATDPDMQASPSFTPENAVRNGGLGVFAHEYLHAMLLGRFASSHDFVFPIEYKTMYPAKADEYGNLCNPTYKTGAPLTYHLCQTKGFTFDQLIESLSDVDRLYQGGYGTLFAGEVDWNQYRSILNSILGGDVLQEMYDVGYGKIFQEQGTTPYKLPYANESCSFKAAIVRDVTIPLGTTLDVNAPFEKTWRIKNTGSCAWDGVQLVNVRAEAMTATTSIPVSATAAGAEMDVTVPMTAPADPGVHTGEWRLRNSAGRNFGPIINLTIYTRPGCSSAPQFSSFTADPPVIGPGALSILRWGQAINLDTLEISGIGPVDPGGDLLLVQPDHTTTYTLRATCGGKKIESQAIVTVDESLPRFAITNVAASADPAQFSGSCGIGKKVLFTGSFVSNGPGVVLIGWKRSDDTTFTTAVSIVNQAGAHTQTTYWDLSGSLTGWFDFKILGPVESGPVRADFSVICSLYG
jgi:hypothetical protein